MKFVWRILGVAYGQLVVFRRQWMWIAQSLISTVGLVVIFSLWGGWEALRHMVVVLLVISGWNVGLNISAQSIGWERVSNEYERRVASPITPLEYLVGSVLGAFIPFFVSEIPLVVLLAAIAGIGAQGVLLVILLSVIATFLGLFLSLSIVLRIRNPMNISAVTNPLQTLTTMLPPVYYTPFLLPEPLRTACAAIPTAVLIDLGRALSGQAAAFPIWLSTASIAVWLIATFLLMKYRFKWGHE
ncbi:MAG: ABC transporter permease [Thermofilaceae archaeon]